MRCKYCPAYWETRDYEYNSLEAWGCYCDPDAGYDFGRELANGDYGCNRKLPYIEKVMKQVEDYREKENEIISKQMGDFVNFCIEQGWYTPKN